MSELLDRGRIKFNILLGVAVGCTIAATWAVWTYLKKRSINTRTLYEVKKISIVNTPEEWETLYLHLKKDLMKIKVLGLDCEWVAKRKVALLQLASPSGQCALVRLFKLQPSFPESLRLLLADTSILKVGVAVVDDGKRLTQDYGLRLGGCVDLRNVLKRCKGSFHCPSRSLKGLAKGVLGVDISKNSSIRCGNWEAETYSPQQVDYAAADAAVALDIFLSLILNKMEQRVSSNQTYTANGHIPVHSSQYETYEPVSTNHESHSLLDPPTVSAKEVVNTRKQLLVIDVNKLQRDEDSCNSEMLLSQERSEEAPDDTLDTSSGITKNDVSCFSHERIKADHLQAEKVFHKNSRVFPSQVYEALQDKEKEEIWKCARSICQGIVDFGTIYQSKEDISLRPPSRRVEKIKNNAYSYRQRPLWDNCKLEAPDGSLLCTCDLKKIQWYLEKELGDTVCDDPLTVRLRFEPANRPESERNYYLQEKENICVVCGHDKDYVRKFVVPYEYRRHFPSALKDHSSHDVLLLCALCQRKSCDFDAVLRLQLAEECNAPVDSGTVSKTFVDHDLQKVRSAGRALKLKSHSIPEERVTELENILRDHYGVDQVTDELIELAANIDTRQTSENYIPHSKQVVRHMARNGGLLAFQARWRQHFLDTMNPQYLPEFWSVDFVPEAWNHRQTL